MQISPVFLKAGDILGLGCQALKNGLGGLNFFINALTYGTPYDIMKIVKTNTF